jgi:hypothetical protein
MSGKGAHHSVIHGIHYNTRLHEQLAIFDTDTSEMINRQSMTCFVNSNGWKITNTLTLCVPSIRQDGIRRKCYIRVEVEFTLPE